jgi:hypothetical protein
MLSCIQCTDATLSTGWKTSSIRTKETLRKDKNCNALVLSEHEQHLGAVSLLHYIFYSTASGLQNKQGSSHDCAPEDPPENATAILISNSMGAKF